MSITLREMRKARGLTQFEVAQAIGFQSASGYHALEHRQRKYFNPAVLEKLAQTFGVPMTQIVESLGED